MESKQTRKDGKIDFPNFANINKESYPIKVSSEAPFYKNNSKNLFDLPIITHFEKDAGPFITSSIIFAKNKEKTQKIQNSSTHRMLLLNEKEMVIRMVEKGKASSQMLYPGQGTQRRFKNKCSNRSTPLQLIWLLHTKQHTVLMKFQ